MVANKLTGKKGILFTAAYVSKFEAMEKALANPNQIAAIEAKKLRAVAMHLNAKTRQAKLIKDLARQFQNQLSSESVQALIAGVSEFLIGQPLLPLTHGTGGRAEMIFFDAEVFRHHWLFVFIDADTQETLVIVNNPEELKQFYEQNKTNVLDWLQLAQLH